MHRRLVVAASTIAIATLGAGPALAHDRPSGPRTAKAGSIELRCRPVAGRPASVQCRWSTSQREGTFRYELFRKLLGSEGRPAVVFTGSDRAYEDGDVVAGARYAYKVRAVHENGKAVARSRVVVVRCCDDRAGRGAGEGRPEANDGRGPKPGEGRRPSPDQRPTPESSRLALQCRATSANGTGEVVCDWSGLPADKLAGYRLYRKVAGGTPMVIASFPGGGTTSFTDSDVAPATTYWYAVEAKSLDRRGTRSNIVEVRCCP